MNEVLMMNWLQMDISAALMIVIVVGVRALNKNTLPRSAFLWLWAIVWLRLCIPFSLPSEWNLYSLLNTAANKLSGPTNMAATAVPTSPVATWTAALSDSTPPQQSWGVLSVLPSTFPQSAPDASAWLLVWLIGAIGLVVFFTVAYIRWYRRFRFARPVKHEFVDRWLSRHRLLRSIQIRQTEKIASPLTYGIIRPVILMPVTIDWSDHKRLEYVLTHEYVHIRRFDSGTKMLLLLAFCLHWYNPFVWLTYVLVNRDIELYCDEAVIRRLGYQRRSDYARTLIHMEEQKLALPSMNNYFSKLAIEERIESIMKMKKTTVAGALSACLLIGSLATVLATSPASASIAASHAGSATLAKHANEYRAGETWKVNNEWEFTVNSVRETTLEGNTIDGNRPAKQVLIVNYSYKNIRPAGGEPLAFSKAHFWMTDAHDPENNSADGSHYTLFVPGMDRIGVVNPGQSVQGAEWVYAFYDKKTDKVEFNVGAYDSHEKLHETKFIVPVEAHKAAK
ncbi:peptidase M56 [Paenibacillus kribbensis]|uniref:Peptidase M56 n=1 Tax=Paenibacillus kribbensis TaxID=172713 RepID=A0A222WNM9_9BACL|nr:M56 family metallopeptidase [Paenibacillus kribbensis]ASR47524.1 peptidase M56 [Paenibacillus kribbensis]